MNARQTVMIVFAIYCATLLQAAVAPHIVIGFGRPDFVTDTIVAIGLLTGFGRGIGSGIWGGFLLASICAPANYGSYMVSRAVAGGLMGMIPKEIHRDNIFLPIASVFVASIATEVVYFVMAPVSPVGWWAKITICQAIYNTVLILPIFWIVQRSLPKESGRPAFAQTWR